MSIGITKSVIRMLVAAVLLVPVLSSCKRHYQDRPSSDAGVRVQEHLTNANKIMVTEESKDIDDFVSRHQYRMQQTGSGLRFELYRKGQGPVPAQHQRVKVSYNLYLLSGEKCYTVTEKEAKEFIPGESDEMRGLQEAVLMMPEGSSAHLVLPSHLAYGMSGDGDKVPGATPVYIDLTLLKVTP